MNHFLVVDGMNILHRAHYITPPMSTSDGIPTNAIRGMTNILLSDISRVKATHCAVVFDRPGLTFRHKLYPEYKAQRPDSGFDCDGVVPHMRKLLLAMGIPVFGKKHIEGDDLIGSLAVRMAKHGKVFIDSNDKDFAALVTKRIRLLKPKSVQEEPMGIEGVFAHYGVYPEQFVEYLMLLGDKVDNIPGVTKVGQKTASKWLQAHGTIKQIWKEAKLTPFQEKNFRAAHPLFKVTRKLVTIQTDLLPDLRPEKLLLTKPSKELKVVWDRLELRTTYAQIVRTLL